MNVDELTADRRRLRHQAAGAAAVLARAAALRPPSGEGRDPSGAVSVTVNADGFPHRWQVANDWPRRLPAEAVDAAVLAACRAATVDRVTRWGEQLDRYQLLPGPRSVPPAGPAESTPTADPLTGGTGRASATSVSALLDALAAVPTLIGVSPSPLVEVTGRAAGGFLAVRLTTDGLSGCTSDPRWTSEQTGARLTSALAAAVTDARAHLDRAHRSSGNHLDAGAVDRLSAEATSLLEHLAGSPDPPAGRRR